MLCGLRNGSVVVLDSRQPTRQNLSTTTVGGGGGGGGRALEGSANGHRRAARSGRNDPASVAAERSFLLRLDSSIDYTHILQDGTRCLVKDRSGGLHTLDLRFQGRPLKVLVPSAHGKRAPFAGRFALDPGETVVATPIAAACGAAARGCTDGSAVVGGGERFLSSPRAWDAFSGAQRTVVDFYGSGDGLADGRGRGGAGGGGSGRAFDAVDDVKACMGDRLRVLSLTSGKTLTDIATPWTGMCLARGVQVVERSGREASCHGDIRFRGIASPAGKPDTVFEAGIRSQEKGGFGRA